MPPADLHLATPAKASEFPTASAWAARRLSESWGCDPRRAATGNLGPPTLRDVLHPADEFFLGAHRSHGNTHNEADDRRHPGLIGRGSGRCLNMA